MSVTLRGYVAGETARHRRAYRGRVSIDVRLDDLHDALEQFDSGYLLTTTDGRVKVVTVDPEPDDDGLRVSDPGKGTVANLRSNDTVTLVFPPREARGYTLLVDGTATVHENDVRVVPANAVLHRPARYADGPPPPDGCGQDCVQFT